MSDPVAVLDPFVRGLAAGAMAAMSLGVARSRVSLHVRLVTLALGVSTICWLITESATLWGAMDHINLLVALAYPIGGVFWLFVVTVFEDRAITPLTLAPPVVLLILGLVMGLAPSRFELLWIIFNGLSGLLALHAIFVIVWGRRDDLIEGRRRTRALVFGLVAVFAVGQVTVAFASRLDPAGPWRSFQIGHLYGGTMLAALTLAAAVLFLEARPALFGARRAEPTADPRVEAADRLLADKLDAFTAAEGWRREGLTIGDLAVELEVPEHRLRRLINSRLGHRNFADFLNASRIAAAKRRLADPREARSTVAAIAFDLGYGSLGPFNRAFRAATGSTPTQWRRQALQASPILEEAG